MNLLKRSILMVLVLFQASLLQADTKNFVAGIEYQEIIPAQHTRAPKGKVELVEVFWYGCPACYRLEHDLEAWLKNKPDNVQFIRMPGQFNKEWELHAGAFYTAESLGILDKVHSAIFKERHDKGNKLDTVDKLAAFFLKFGISREKFVGVLNSIAVRSRKGHAKGMVQRYGVHSVPTFVINGKYRTNETMAGSRKDMFRVIEELIAAEAAAQQPSADDNKQ